MINNLNQLSFKVPPIVLASLDMKIVQNLNSIRIEALEFLHNLTYINKERGMKWGRWDQVEDGGFFF